MGWCPSQKRTAQRKGHVGTQWEVPSASQGGVSHQKPILSAAQSLTSSLQNWEKKYISVAEATRSVVFCFGSLS